MVRSVVRCVVGPDRHATRVRRCERHRMHHLLLGETQDETRRDDGALNGGDSAVEAPIHPSGREGEIETAADLVAEDDRLENLARGHRYRVASQMLPRGEGSGRGGSAEVPDEEKAGVVHSRCVAACVVHAGRGCRGDLGPVEPKRGVGSAAAFQRERAKRLDTANPVAARGARQRARNDHLGQLEMPRREVSPRGRRHESRKLLSHGWALGDVCSHWKRLLLLTEGRAHQQEAE